MGPDLRVRRIFYVDIWRSAAAGVLVLAVFLAYAAFTLPARRPASADLPSSAVIYATDCR